jgi:hypothetical protein
MESPCCWTSEVAWVERRRIRARSTTFLRPDVEVQVMTDRIPVVVLGRTT